MSTAETAPIGHNRPPEPTPYEKAVEEINALYGEAKQWLDGEEVNRQDMADGLAKLLNLIRDARKRADESRKAEKKPHDEIIKEIQGRYNPLLKKADLATDTCKKALAPWLNKLDREKQEAAAKARREAEEKTRAAQEAIRASSADNLADREAAEALLKDAKKADAAANKAARDTAKATGGVGRAVSLRTHYVAVMTDPILAARHFWQTDPQEFQDFLQTLAERAVRHGSREIPGFEVREQKTAV